VKAVCCDKTIEDVLLGIDMSILELRKAKTVGYLS